MRQLFFIKNVEVLSLPNIFPPKFAVCIVYEVRHQMTRHKLAAIISRFHIIECICTVVVKIKFRFSIRTTAVERVDRCRIEPVLLQEGYCKITIARPWNGAVSIKIAVLRPLVTPYNG